MNSYVLRVVDTPTTCFARLRCSSYQYHTVAVVALFVTLNKINDKQTPFVLFDGTPILQVPVYIMLNGMTMLCTSADFS